MSSVVFIITEACAEYKDNLFIYLFTFVFLLLLLMCCEEESVTIFKEPATHCAILAVLNFIASHTASFI